ncbi:galectin 17 [Channa argus]|uniref:galectin 17 n=1 Tax=Channa argus TaxID=215402 RepID=UPI0029450310|nr:hypothetical protein Q8A73_000098 [Channa argus]
MGAVRKRHWSFTFLQCFVIGSLVDSSYLSSATHLLSITTRVGNQVVLPCSWKLPLEGASLSACHIQWLDPVETVYEQQGELSWQAPEFTGRAEVPEEKLKSGDCSLIISDAQIGDTGTYESFMVVDGMKSRRTRVFIQSVKLSVFDHKSPQSRRPGEDLVLDLYTSHSMRVVFLGRNSSEWLDLWMRDDNNTEHVEKHPQKEQLTIKKLKRSDEGLYKVLDEQGLTISTVHLSVEENSTVLKLYQDQDSQILAGDAAKSSCSAPLLLLLLLLVSVLVTNF